MTLEEQRKLFKLQHKDYRVVWKYSDYKRGLILPICESVIEDAKSETMKSMLRQHLGEYVFCYNNDSMCILAKAGIHEFYVIMRHDSNDFDKLLAEN